ncbi:hypothetical protein [Rhizosphaericola mali]|uniref:Right-handed parallel beta-helix repeat-containing protein n=1 Tax=Rhizosphaericola mali TaxID=2545455 RepID=A0A5P2G776_9BACT|nr:hypothetical protein [Rhizosphaericola mali]QES89630.1 hypothetical protein E0W69_013470 [Rhizosphaericola mali]
MSRYLYISFFSIIVISFFACQKSTLDYVSQPNIGAGQEVTEDTLTGSVKGTLKSGKIYYFATDIRINKGDTLLMQPGSVLIALGDGSQNNSPQITNSGTLISYGTQENPNFITVLPTLRQDTNVCKGYWGGIQCDTTANVIIKWTHLEFAGAPAGSLADPALYSSGDPRYTIAFTNINGQFIVENSWIYGSKDDGMRVVSGKINVVGNTFESCGKQGGESFNMKSGTVGNVAYNVSIGAATNSFKVSNNKGSTPVQAVVNVYNNTILNGGFRQVKDGRGGSIDYEQGAAGKVYNNILVNVRFGLRYTADADVNDIEYGNTLFYGNDAREIEQFWATDGVAKQQSSDIVSTTVGANDPLFTNYNVNIVDFSKFTSVKPTLVLDITQMPYSIITGEKHSFSLQSTSPALGKGYTGFTPTTDLPTTGNYGATLMNPGKDIGAYQSDGTGNQHYISSLEATF